MCRSVVYGLVLLVLAGCGGGSAGDSGQASRSSAASSSAATTTSAETLSRVDVNTCQNFVAKAGAAYGWLTTLEREGTISGDVGTPGYIEAYQLGGLASSLFPQGHSPRLASAMQTIEQEGKALHQAIDSQQVVSPTRLRIALDSAADACEDGGFVITWHK